MIEYSVYLMNLIRKDQYLKKTKLCEKKNHQIFTMNTACSICLGSFTSISDISSIPCGHVFHTDCIKKWLQTRSNSCSQCRKMFQDKEITKLFFSTNQSENDLISELEEAKIEAEKRSLKFQKKNIELQKENSDLRKENSDVYKENLKFREENLKLSRHLTDVQSDSEIKERTLNRRIEKLTVEIKNVKFEARNPKKQRVDQGGFNSTCMQTKTQASKENIIDNHSLIAKAIEKNDIGTCQNILDRVLNKNPEDIIGSTALHLAAQKGRIKIFQMIMARIENKNPKDDGGWTPLHEAAIGGHTEIVKIILDTVEDKNPKCNDGSTPLHKAAYKGHVEIVKMILDKVQDKNPKDNQGWTPLSLARSNGHVITYQTIWGHSIYTLR